MAKTNITLDRPATVERPAGSLGFSLFQQAYVVRNLEDAMATFRDRFGIVNFGVLPLPEMANGTSMRIVLAWSAGQLIELIEPRGPNLNLYTDWMVEGTDIRLHHFGYLIENDAQWLALQERLEAEGRPHVYAGDAGICRFIYVFAAELGHYLEYIYPSQEGKLFFESLPAN